MASRINSERLAYQPWSTIISISSISLGVNFAGMASIGITNRYTMVLLFKDFGEKEVVFFKAYMFARNIK